MKNFNYNGKGTLSFTHLNHDFVIHEVGPHQLPEDSELVKSLVSQSLLTEVQESQQLSKQELSINKLKK